MLEWANRPLNAIGNDLLAVSERDPATRRLNRSMTNDNDCQRRYGHSVQGIAQAFVRLADFFANQPQRGADIIGRFTGRVANLRQAVLQVLPLALQLFPFVFGFRLGQMYFRQQLVALCLKFINQPVKVASLVCHGFPRLIRSRSVWVNRHTW